MFNMLEEIISVVVGGILLLSSFIGFIVSVVKSFKNKKMASTAQKTNEITDLAKDKVAEIENLYAQAAHVLKAMGISTGDIKKENVMNFIQKECCEKNLKFDAGYWSAEIEKLVGLMNTHKEASKQIDDNNAGSAL